MSREIDEQVSSAVMGEQVVPLNGRNLRRVKGKTRGGMTTTTYTEIPAYSADPAAAMEVVERMVALGWQYEIKNGWTAGLPHAATFWRTHSDGREESHTADAKTIPAAIATAALRAVGGEGGRT